MYLDVETNKKEVMCTLSVRISLYVLCNIFLGLELVDPLCIAESENLYGDLGAKLKYYIFSW